MTILFDSTSCVKPASFGSGLVARRPPIITEARRTRDDEPSAADRLEWYSDGQADLSDPRDWSQQEINRRLQNAMYNDAVACGFLPC